jgi:HD-like signal output (HDOD) protein
VASLAVTTLRSRRRGHIEAVPVASVANDEAPAPAASAPSPRRPLADTPSPARPQHDAPRLDRLTLPAFPASLARLMTTLDETSDAKAIEAALALDPVLSALVIRAAGSAASGRVAPTRSLRDAVLALGSRDIYRLAITQLARGLVVHQGTIATFFWEQSVGTAVRAQAALEVLQCAQSEHGYLGGLLHNVGAIALHKAVPSTYERALSTSIAEDRALEEVERATFGLEGEALTQKLLAQWHLPPHMTTLLRAPEDSIDRRVLEWARCTSLVENSAWRTMATSARGSGDVPWLAERSAHAAQELQLDDAELGVIHELSRTRVAEMLPLLRQSPA